MKSLGTGKIIKNASTVARCATSLHVYTSAVYARISSVSHRSRAKPLVTGGSPASSVAHNTLACCTNEPVLRAHIAGNHKQSPKYRITVILDFMGGFLRYASGETPVIGDRIRDRQGRAAKVIDLERCGKRQNTCHRIERSTISLDMDGPKRSGGRRHMKPLPLLPPLSRGHVFL